MDLTDHETALDNLTHHHLRIRWRACPLHSKDFLTSYHLSTPTDSARSYLGSAYLPCSRQRRCWKR